MFRKIGKVPLISFKSQSQFTIGNSTSEGQGEPTLTMVPTQKKIVDELQKVIHYPSL
jgi:hypothetical protein